MDAFNVAVCVVELKPNYNDAKRFSGRHPGRVFICNSFGSLPDDMVKWGDAPKLDASERRTNEDERDRYTVRCDQYKCMQTSFARFAAKIPLCLWPDPQELCQEVIEKEITQRAALAPRAFLHFTRTALVAEKDGETNQYKRVVKKIGLDPHYSYANQLCDVAWSRAHGTATFLLPGEEPADYHRSDGPVVPFLPGLPAPTMEVIEDILDRCQGQEVCGRCHSFPTTATGTAGGRRFCPEKRLMALPNDPGCEYFVERES
ncbi:MAG: hypothetical protein ABI906_03865 [Pseudomonadota bacterium]